MIYPELATIDSTADEDLGLTITWTNGLNAELFTKDECPTQGAYLTRVVKAALASYAKTEVQAVQGERFKASLLTADSKTIEEAAAVLGVDLTVDVPPEKDPHGK